MHNPIRRWINPGVDTLQAGYSWETTPDGMDERIRSVYKPAVIPQPLTRGGQNSFPDAYFMHRGGKVGKTAIQTAFRVVN
jgi:hypothetical protein